MEDKRILWVSAAVGVFLLIIVGTALVLYAPPKNGDTGFTALPADTVQSWSVQPQNTSPSAQGNLPQGNQSEQTAASQNTSPASAPSSAAANAAGTDTGGSADTAGIVQSRDLTVISNNTTVYTKDGVTTIDLAAPADRPEQKTVDLPKGMQAASDVKTLVPINPAEYMGAQTETQPKNTAALKSAPAANSSAAKTASVKKPTAKPAPKPADRYWVQAASFTDKMNAETARSILADEKIPAEVFTYQDKKGLTYYRLRVGPYTTESEAEYWNSRIKLIDHFASAQSYVTNSTKAVK